MTYGEFLANGDTVAVAAERYGTSFSDVLPGVNADALREILAPVMDKNALLVTDGNTSDSPCAAALGVSHEALNQSSGECVRSELHIKNVSNRHSRLEGFIGGRWGILTRYLVGYLRWYHLIVLQKYPTSRFCLASAMGAMSVYTIRELSDCLLDWKILAYVTANRTEFLAVTRWLCGYTVPTRGIDDRRFFAYVL